MSLLFGGESGDSHAPLTIQTYRVIFGTDLMFHETLSASEPAEVKSTWSLSAWAGID